MISFQDSRTKLKVYSHSNLRFWQHEMWRLHFYGKWCFASWYE